MQFSQIDVEQRVKLLKCNVYHILFCAVCCTFGDFQKLYYLKIVFHGKFSLLLGIMLNL